MSNLIKPKALITGASSGIGKATALEFAKAGIEVALVSRSMDKLTAVTQAAAATGVTAKAYELDLANLDQVQEQIKLIAADFGGIDILVNNAGIGYISTLRETPLTDWLTVVNLNLTSVFQCIVGILPTMESRGGGTIINVASIAGKQPFPGWGAYSVSKAGLIALSKTVAAEERDRGIRVTAICPGAVDTELWDALDSNFDRKAMLTPQTVAQTILHTALLPKQAVIDELVLMPSAGSL